MAKLKNMENEALNSWIEINRTHLARVLHVPETDVASRAIDLARGADAVKSMPSAAYISPEALQNLDLAIPAEKIADSLIEPLIKIVQGIEAKDVEVWSAKVNKPILSPIAEIKVAESPAGVGSKDSDNAVFADGLVILFQTTVLPSL